MLFRDITDHGMYYEVLFREPQDIHDIEETDKTNNKVVRALDIDGKWTMDWRDELTLWVHKPESMTVSLYRSDWDTEENRNDAVLLAQTITESMHGDFEGWNKTEQTIIERYLADIAMAMWDS